MLIGVFPFFYSSPGAPMPYGMSMLGMGGLPRCLAKWAEIGRQVVAARAGKPRYVGSGAAGAKRRCPNTVEKVPHFWCNKSFEYPPPGDSAQQ